MARVHFTNKAVQDLTEIWFYTVETWSEKQAGIYYEMLISSCNTLAKKPDPGRQYEMVAKGLLGYKSGEHIIFYFALSKSEIEVIRILHGMMDLKQKL